MIKQVVKNDDEIVHKSISHPKPKKNPKKNSKHHTSKEKKKFFLKNVIFIFNFFIVF